MTKEERPTLTSLPAGGVASVFGASGGVGEALCSALEQSGQFAQLCRFSRASDPSFDLSKEESIARAVGGAAVHGDLRFVIDATGFLHDKQQQPEKTWRTIDADAMARAFALNAIGPALLMKHVLPALPLSGKALFATLSARVGSIGDNRLGGWYSYRASKAALNQLVRTASIELKRNRPDAICVALHPGTVATRLSEPFSRGGLQVHQPCEAAHHLIDVIEGLGAEDSGGFFDWRGDSVPW